ncbi:hypothetical protein ANN_23333 [Periplaneta americana]|uniref:Ionotropic glutamate receptor L-glutamate and glycine-binding domain-containing protein n=1 Tax=Periplaneta americana TaxID=6978 RepID=A0ABQ8SL91_PERAM|nr:hypothetical protein ANN_23333 [Periplaneta americana]
MILTMVLSASVWLQAVSAKEHPLLFCLNVVSEKYFTPKCTLVISLPSYNEDDQQDSVNKDFSDEELVDSLVEQLHRSEKWPIITSRVSDFSDVASMRKVVYDKYQSYVIFGYASSVNDIVQMIAQQVQMLSYHPAWNPRARFAVIPLIEDDIIDIRTEIAQRLLTLLWQWKIINVVIFINVPEQNMTSPSKCNDVRDVILLDTWIAESRGYFAFNANLFPIKVENNLQTCPIKAATFPLEIVVGGTEYFFINGELEQKVRYTEGWEVQFIQLIAEHLNSSLEFLLPPPNNEKWGTLSEDGTFTGLIGDLVYNRADIGFAAWPLHPIMLMIVDPTKSYLQDVWAWYVPCAKKIPRWKSIFLVFAPATWMAGLFSVLFSVLVMVFLAKGKYLEQNLREFDAYVKVDTCFSCVMAVIFGVSVHAMPRTSPLRMFFISWMDSYEEILASGVEFGYNPFIDAIVEESEQYIRKKRVACHDKNIPPCLDWVAYYDNFSLLCSTTFMDYVLTRWYLDDNGKPLICKAGDTFYSTKTIEAGFASRLLERGMELQRIQAAARTRDALVDKYSTLNLEHLQVFQAFLTTFIIEPGLQHQMSSIQEILASEVNYGYNSGFDIIFRDSTDEISQTILNNRLECNEGNNPPCLDWVAYHDNFSLLCSKKLLEYILTRHYLDKNGNPLMCQAGGVFFPLNYVTYMEKWNPLQYRFNDMIIRALEYGLFDKWLQDDFHLQRIQAGAIARKKNVDEYFDLTLEHSQGIFAILLPGIALSILAFIGEVLVSLLYVKLYRLLKVTSNEATGIITEDIGPLTQNQSCQGANLT